MRALLMASALLLCCGVPAACQEAGGQPYSAVVVGTMVSSGTSETWTYTVTNTSQNPVYGLWLMAIEVDDAADVDSVLGPPGWGIDDSQPHFVTWIDFVGEVPTGQSQDGFEVTFSGSPAYQMYSVMFDNIENPGETPVDFGSVLLIPEPAGACALLVGLVSLGALRVRRRLG